MIRREISGLVLVLLGCSTGTTEDAGTALTADASTGGVMGTGGAAAGGASTSSGGSSGPPADAAALDAPSEAGPPATTCPVGLPGPALVFIGAEGGPFCIDAREVTQGEYAEFLAAMTDAGTIEQPPQCASNVRFTPSAFPGGDEPAPPDACAAAAFNLEEAPNRAVGCVDWCDARAYCAWSGKRLCHGVGGALVLPETGMAELGPVATEWQLVCTSGGASAYPYGNELEEGRCVDRTATLEVRVARLGSATCAGTESPFDEVRDLPGNVSEWTGVCDHMFTRCLAGGGTGGPDDSCSGGTSRANRHDVQANRGIRCCADAVPEP
jgi:hypothetical protein